MSQSERERALAVDVITRHSFNGEFGTCECQIAKDFSYKPMSFDEWKKHVDMELRAALDTPQEPTPALRDRFKEFDEAVKFVRANGYSDWNGTANRQEITLTGCANLVRKALYETGATAAPEPTPAAPPGLVTEAHIHRAYEWLDLNLGVVYSRRPSLQIESLAKLIATVEAEALAAAPQPALSPDALREILEQHAWFPTLVEHQCRCGQLIQFHSVWIEHVLAALAPAPREGA